MEQLRGESLAARRGAIDALERIARADAAFDWPIMETLTAYVRENAPAPAEAAAAAAGNTAAELGAERAAARSRRLRRDIAAILTVLGRRTDEQRGRDRAPDGKGFDCQQCKLRYPIQNDVPVMLVDRAEPID